MKKNITINLCGRLFQIDEDAYEMLKHYIESLRSSFGKQKGGDEIVDDIESRIAELFDAIRQQGTEAITIDHVKDVITRIGKPEQLTDDDALGGNNSDNWEDKARATAQSIYDNVRARTAGKKLFRNPKDKMLAGVLSGLAVYTNTSPVIWRLLTVLFTVFYGIGLVAYIVLAIVVPEAKTPEQLLQMEGKEVTPQHLADVVVEKNGPSATPPSLLRSLFSILLKILFGIFVGICIVVCLMLSLGFLFVLVVLVCVLVFPITSNMPFSLEAMGLAELYQTNPWVLILFTISLFLLLLIPIYAIVHMVLTLSGKTQPMSIGQRIAWVVLWIVALCCVVPCGITMAGYKENLRHKELLSHAYFHDNVAMDEVDADFLRQGGWNLLKADNCDHYTWSGRHPSGDRLKRYLDTYNDACEAVLQVERKQEVTPGIYRIDCLVRAEGPGAYVYAIGADTLLTEIPAYENKPAGLYEALQKEMEDSLYQAVGLKYLKLDINPVDVSFHSDILDGWSIVSFENIVTTTGTIAYGMTSNPDMTGKPCRAKWFSASDFTLTRTGDLPVTKE